MLFLGILEASLCLDWVDNSIDGMFCHLKWHPLYLLPSVLSWSLILIRLLISIILPRHRAAIAHVLPITQDLLAQRSSWLTIVLFDRLCRQVVSSSATLLIERSKCALLV